MGNSIGRPLQQNDDRTVEQYILHYNQGCIFCDLEQYDKALDSFTRSIELKPDYYEAHLGKSAVYFDLKQYSEGLKSAEDAISLNASDDRGYNIKGYLLLGLQNYAEAKECFKKVSDSDHFSVKWLGQGLAHSYLEEKTEAIECFNNAIVREPDTYNGYYQKAIVLIGLEQYEEAESCLNKAISLNKDNAFLHYNLGNTLKALGRYEESMNSYNAAIGINSKDYQSYNNKGSIYEVWGKNDEAMCCYNDAIDIYERDNIQDNFVGYYNKAKLLDVIGLHSESIEFYKKAKLHLSETAEHHKKYFEDCEKILSVEQIAAEIIGSTIDDLNESV